MTYIYEENDFTVTENADLSEYSCVIIVHTVTDTGRVFTVAVASNEIDASNLSEVVDLAQFFELAVDDEDELRAHQNISVNLNF